jgi:hypothetical protein
MDEVSVERNSKKYTRNTTLLTLCSKLSAPSIICISMFDFKSQHNISNSHVYDIVDAVCCNIIT